MSYTEIFSFDKGGNAHFAGEVKNAWRGGMAVWRIMEERYLPPYKIWNHETSRLMAGIASQKGVRNPMQDVWDLADNPKVPEHERIVLFTTYDHCLVKRENVQKVIDAFRKFEGDTSLPDQAAVIEQLIKDNNCIAVGWNQNSVLADTWGNAGGYDEEKGTSIPYNCLTGDAHYWLFDELGKRLDGDNE